MNTSTYTVTGMTCDHCVGAVRTELSRIPGVTDVAVDLTSGQVTVTSANPVSPDDVRAKVDEAGYDLAS